MIMRLNLEEKVKNHHYKNISSAYFKSTKKPSHYTHLKKETVRTLEIKNHPKKQKRNQNKENLKYKP